MRIKERHLAIFFESLHEEIRNGDGREDVKGLGSDIAGFGLEIEKVMDVQMPDIEGDGYGSETGPELIDGDCGIIDDFDPWVDAA